MDFLKSPVVTYIGALLAFFAIVTGVMGWFDPNIAWALAGLLGFSSVGSLRLFMSEKFGLTLTAAVLGILTSIALAFGWITPEQFALFQSAWGSLTAIGLQKAKPKASG